MNQFKLKLFILILVTIITGSILTYWLNTLYKPQVYEISGQSYKPGISEEVDKAVNQAKHVYEQNQKLGVDFSKGPCLTNALLPGWVADIAHNPRQSTDDLAENQCEAFREGKATSFVELDPKGNLLRVSLTLKN